ncbi:MAG: excinuclease ABC subunit UvrA [Candidatus Omnitrophota bacterium]
MDAIVLKGVRTHNLKNFDLKLEHRKLYAVTGVSGSGKSSLAFDTLYAEGQRRYVESLSAYARQFLERMERPEVESVSGILPAIAIEAKNAITNARSTVGTQTEINDYLRVLFSRIARGVCPCGGEVRRLTPIAVADHLIAKQAGREALILFRVALAAKASAYLREALRELERQGFSELYTEGRLVGTEELLGSRKKHEDLYPKVDRLVLEPGARTRLVDSIETAMRFGREEFQVAFGKTLLAFGPGLRCLDCGKTFREPSPNLFSFNSPLGACPSCQGFGRTITIDGDLVVPDTGKSLLEGAIEPWTKPSATWEYQQMLKFCRRRKIPVHQPWKTLAARHRKAVLEGIQGDDYFSVSEFFRYLEKKTYKMHVRVFLSRYRGYIPCKECGGSRLKSEALCFRIGGRSIADLQEMSIGELQDFFKAYSLSSEERALVESVYADLARRIRFLNDVGLGYLTLARTSRTLSGGEVQRIHLAASLGSALVDTLYVLDEPSIGLHERDNGLLIALLRELRDLGNTVVVVEHDRAMIEAAEEVLDLGPGGGEQGGQLVFQGTVEGLRACARSVTGQYLSREKEVGRTGGKRAETADWLEILGASEHNLKNISVKIPLGQFVVITGVSGSGKSTLLYEILYRNYLRMKGQGVQDVGKVGEIRGLEKLDEVILVDQTPIGRSARSNPATYIQAYDEIRKAFARTPDAKRLGFEARHFSFNVDGGRCESCKGDGRIKVEMHFLADIFIPCEACQGRRFKKEIFEVRYQGRTIDDVLRMTVDEALGHFAEEPRVAEKLVLLEKAGLGYLRLGQPSPDLSGGEAQRLKLAAEIEEKRGNRCLYLFDEPTTGLHYDDIRYLMRSFETLLDRGHSLVVIEHNMEVIRLADYLIDLGPEGGAAGGEVIYEGPLQGIAENSRSHTGRYLKAIFQRDGFPGV